ncbi:MAG: site-specific integrase [Trebonia sp.]
MIAEADAAGLEGSGAKEAGIGITRRSERLISESHASPHGGRLPRRLRLLLRFIHARTGKEPAQLDLADRGAPVISAFLDHLEQERHNNARTRNARLAAIRAFFRCAALRH